MAINRSKGIEASHRRQIRDAQKRSRELAREAKEQAKLSELEKARLEVAEYENQLELLMSVHKERGEPWDWASEAVSLPPPNPTRHSYLEQRAKQTLILLPLDQQKLRESGIADAAKLDDGEFSDALKAHVEAKEEWFRLVALSRRINASDCRAFVEAFATIDPLAELSEYGASATLAVTSPRVACCDLSVSGVNAVPPEVKSLTSTGKLSIKGMPRAKFHEVYQDYVCSCMLRVAREVFSLLPVQTVFVTASAALADGQSRPVLSAEFSRGKLEALDFGNVDPSTAVEQFRHRGDFKASRKAGAFLAIVPLDPEEYSPVMLHESAPIGELVAAIRKMRSELNSTMAELPNSAEGKL